MPSLDTTIAVLALQDAKDYLKIPAGTTSEDTLLTYLINEVSRWINTYCQRQFLEKSWTEYYDGDGTDRLKLRNFPIGTLSSLYDDPDRVFGSDTQITIASNVLVYKKTGIIRLWNDESSFTKAVANVKVVYTAGYALASMPQDLQLAAKRLIAIQYMRATHKQHDIQSQSIRDQSVTFMINDLPPSVKTILNSYRQLDRMGEVLE